MLSTPRRTQRVPRSCTACYARKTRCNKEIPCSTCITRGETTSCRRETVLVRGRLRTADTPSRDASYDDLRFENLRLRAALDAKGGGDAAAHDTGETTRSESSPSIPEIFEQRLIDASSALPRERSVRSLEDIAYPSPQCAGQLLDLAEVWTSWVHHALYFPLFRGQCEQFWSGTTSPDGGHQLCLWQAIYFAVLSSTLICVDQQEFVGLGAPHSSQSALVRGWYDASLYFLDLGDFTQRADLAVVQAIAILGTVATNVGDYHRHATLWACAIRIAQYLRLGSDTAHPVESIRERELRRRLWWTLVLCEWLPIPVRPFSVNENDFECALPETLDDNDLDKKATTKGESHPDRPRPVAYHLAMIQIAITMYRMRIQLQMHTPNMVNIAKIVVATDDQLATVIARLPPHLQSDEVETLERQNWDRDYPWLLWQRRSLAMVLLYYRIAINRRIQLYWTELTIDFARARSICLGSAVAMIRSIGESAGSSSTSRMRPWAFAMHIFSACVTLCIEMQQAGQQDTHEELNSAVVTGMLFLDQIKDHNSVAAEALRLLQDLGGYATPNATP